jgi:membrane dipeptidase
MQLFDLHNDALLELPPDELRAYLRAADPNIKINLSIWTTRLPDPMATIAERKPLVGNHNLHIEDAWFLTPKNIDRFIGFAPFSVGLTWNDENAIAGGAHSPAGITEWGHKVIEKLENAGIQIDTAHLNRRSFWQFARVTKRPILCTHTAFNAVTGHLRNLTDFQVKKIIASNGLIGLTFVRQFLSKSPNKCGIANAVKHILHYQKIDPECRHLGIGTDFYGTDPVPNLGDYPALINLMTALKENGVTDTVIQKIFYKNAVTFRAQFPV